MTAFEGTNQNLAWDSALQADDLDVSFGTYMSAAASDFWGYNPSVAHSRAYDVYASQVDMDTLDVDSDAMSFDPSAISRREGMGLDDQKAWIEKEGLTGHLVPQEGYNEDTLKLLAEAKHRERENAMIREAAPAWMAVPGFVAGLGMSFLDPINLASGFFPVVGQARQMQMLSRASGVWGATARRAGIGLAEGTVGAMAVEPIIQLGRSAEQADWEMSQSVLNIAFGSIIGATMHVGKGAFGDLMRLKNRQRQPWESAPSTDSTEALRTSFVDDMYEAAQEAGANITREQAIAESIRFDSRARAWAYDTGRTPEEYYRTRRPDFRAAIARDAENFEKTVGAELEGIAAEDAAPVEGRADTGAEEGIMPAEAAGKQGDAAEAAIAEIREASAAETPAAEAQPPATRFYTAESGATRYRGDDVSILNGHEKENARYELRELSDVIPSHDPEAQFARRADYPENVQERPYHSDAGEQQKVLRNAATLEPGYLVNNNPDAVNGPPIITEEGIVLGGNSRTMSIQLAYASHPERAEAYRSSLKKWGQMFGIDPAAVDSFQRPVLVRVVEGGQDAQAMAVKSRLYNQSQTQGLLAKAEGVSKGKLVSRETLDALTQGMEDFDTLRGFMASPKSKEFIQALFNDGVIEQTQLHRLTDEHGLLNDAGKDLVENALRGHIVQDYDVLAAAPAGVLANLDRSLPALARLKARREGWDMSGVVTRALKLINRAQKEDRALEIMLSQGSMAGDTAKAGVQAMALTLKNATSKEVQLRFNALADAAERTHRGQSVMVLAQAANDTPAKAFIRTFMKPIASVDGEPVPAFNPSGNARHAAIQYVYENGGKGRSVSVAEEALQKTIASRKTPKEAKAEARAMLGELSQLDGSVAIYEPQLGPYFRYKQGEELWQSSAHRESSIAAVRKQYEGTDKWMMAPNGKATNLSEQQWLIVRTPEFKRWFGDWEADPANASKVVDANGEPLVVFHGSPEKDIEVFANHSQLEGHESGHRSTGDAGIYTSPRRSYAERYTAADLASDESSGGRVYELYLNIRRPATLVEAGLSHPDKITAKKAAELREQGYDGIMYEHRKRPEYIVLDPRQIKSTENRGSFDPENPNSLYQGKASRNAEALRDIERQYDEAVAKNDMQRAGELVVQYSRLKGYAPESDYRMSHRAPDASYPDEIPSLRQIAEGFDLVPDDFWTHPERYMSMGEWDRESIAAIRSAMDDLKNGGEGKVTMYRAVSSDVKEGSFRNSDWITPSREYAMEHIRHSLNGKGRIIEMEVKAEDIYWDGNSINEWGYDDRQSYAYRNTKNNRKSLAPVTRDENGNVIPLTKRFNERNPDVLYQGGTYDAENPNIYYQGMKRSERKTQDEFKADARAGKEEYFVPEETPDAVREALGIDELIINLPSNFVRHLDNDHPKMADALFADTTRVLKYGDRIEQTGRTREGAPKYSVVLHEGGDATIVVVAFSRSKKKGKRISPITAYKNSAEKIDAFVDERIRATRSTNAGGDPSLPKPLTEDELRAFAALEKSMADETQKVKSDLSDVAEADRAFIEQGPKYSGDVAETARARVIFNATEDGRAVIEFFKSADASSAPHELYHIFRRELEETANMEGVSERAKRMWRDACEFVGAEPGQKWTVEMEEKFAKAGERFLMEGKAPIPALQGLFDKMKQWFTEIYQNADEAGLEISDGMRRMFGEMLTPSAEEADAMFRYSLGKILDSDPSEGMDTRIDLPEDTGDARQVLAEAQADAQGRVERQLEGFAERLPEEDIAAFRDEYNEAMATEDEAIRQAEQRGELLREAAACDLGGM